MSLRPRLRAIVELAGYAALLGGLPLVLARFGGLPSPSELRVALALHWVSPHLGLQLVGLLGWVVYAYLLAWSAVEVASALRRVPSAAPGVLHPLNGRLAAVVLVAAGRVVAPGIPLAHPAVVPAVAVAASAAAADTVASVPPAAAPPMTHVVTSGDCLWDLALDYYGEGTRWPVIWEANRDRIPDPEDIAVGVVLVIPPAGAVQSGGEEYTVEPGDSLSSIAAGQLGNADRWGIIWADNKDRVEPDGAVFVDPDLIRPGWRLELSGDPSPAGAPSAAKPPEAVSPAPAKASAGPAPAIPPTPHSSVPASAAPQRLPSVPAPTTEPRSVQARPAQVVPSADHDVASQLAEAAAALPVAAGAIWWGIRRRRRTARHRPAPGYLPTPPPAEAQRAAAAASEGVDAAERVDLALRHLRMVLGRRRNEEDQPVVSAVLVRPDGAVEVVISGAGRPPSGWSADSPDHWVLPAEVELEIPPAERRAPAPCPSLVTLGTTEDDATVLVHLEAAGVVGLTGGSPTDRRELTRRWVAELALSPYGSCVRVLTTVIGELPEGNGRVTVAETSSDLAELVASAAEWGASAAAGAETSLVAGRLLGIVGDPLWIAIDPEGALSVDPGPGLVLIGPARRGLVVDLDTDEVSVEGIGAVRLVGPAPDELDAAAAAAALAVSDPGVAPEDPELSAYDISSSAVDDGDETGPNTAKVTVRILGEVCVEGVGAPPRPFLLSAVAALVLSKDGMSRSKFIEMLFRNEPVDQTVRNRLGELRSWLGWPEAVIDNGDWIRLGEGVGCDWWDFERLSRNQLTRSKALRLVRGVPLGGVLQGWHDRETKVGGIEAAIIGTALKAAQDCLGAGRPEEALAAADVALRFNEFDQRAVQAKMRAYAELGDVVGVEQTYSEADGAFNDDEDIDPETTELYAALSKKLGQGR